MLKTIHDQYGIAALLDSFDTYDWGEFTLEEIGIVLGITRERVRQIQEQALKKLSHPKYGRHLKRYVEDYSSPELYNVDSGRESNREFI